MNKKIWMKKGLAYSILFAASAFCLALTPSSTKAQNYPTEISKTISCKLTVNDKSYDLKPNEAGYFQRIDGVKQNAVLPIEVVYPDAKAGEKIIVQVLDGGKIDGVAFVKAISLNGGKNAFSIFMLQIN